jgi:alanine dehydrogenase
VEYDLFRRDQILYTYLHLAANRELTEAMLKKEIKGVAYETIEDDEGQLPCLTPMSEIAGRLAVQEGAKYLEKTFGGRGVLLGGVPGVERGKLALSVEGWWGPMPAKLRLVWVPKLPSSMSMHKGSLTLMIFSDHELPHYTVQMQIWRKFSGNAI